MVDESDDVLEELVAEWKSELPSLDASPMLVVGRILRIANILETELTRVLKPSGIHYTDFDILATLRRKGLPYELTPTELSASVILTSGAMTAALGRLEKASLIRRSRDKDDGRSRRVRLTAKGTRLVEKVASVRFELAESNVASLSKKEFDMMARMLKKLLADLDTMQD